MNILCLKINLVYQNKVINLQNTALEMTNHLVNLTPRGVRDILHCGIMEKCQQHGVGFHLIPRNHYKRKGVDNWTKFNKLEKLYFLLKSTKVTLLSHIRSAVRSLIQYMFLGVCVFVCVCVIRHPV